jgi:hypothetical protein
MRHASALDEVNLALDRIGADLDISAVVIAGRSGAFLLDSTRDDREQRKRIATSRGWRRIRREPAAAGAARGGRLFRSCHRLRSAGSYARRHRIGCRGTRRSALQPRSFSLRSSTMGPGWLTGGVRLRSVTGRTVNTYCRGLTRGGSRVTRGASKKIRPLRIVSNGGLRGRPSQAWRTSTWPSLGPNGAIPTFLSM